MYGLRPQKLGVRGYKTHFDEAVYTAPDRSFCVAPATVDGQQQLVVYVTNFEQRGVEESYTETQLANGALPRRDFLRTLLYEKIKHPELKA